MAHFADNNSELENDVLWKLNCITDQLRDIFPKTLFFKVYAVI